MNNIEFDKWMEAMQEPVSLKILFYLREFNPNVKIGDLQKALDVDIGIIREKLANLESMGMVISKNGLYMLSTDGRTLVNGFYHDLGEAIPK